MILWSCHRQLSIFGDLRMYNTFDAEVYTHVCRGGWQGLARRHTSDVGVVTTSIVWFVGHEVRGCLQPFLILPSHREHTKFSGRHCSYVG